MNTVFMDVSIIIAIRKFHSLEACAAPLLMLLSELISSEALPSASFLKIITSDRQITGRNKQKKESLFIYLFIYLFIQKFFNTICKRKANQIMLSTNCATYECGSSKLSREPRPLKTASLETTQ